MQAFLLFLAQNNAYLHINPFVEGDAIIEVFKKSGEFWCQWYQRTPIETWDWDEMIKTIPNHVPVFLT